MESVLGVLDKGIPTLGDNKRVDFSRCLIFMTSNLGAAEMSALMPAQQFVEKLQLSCDDQIGIRFFMRVIIPHRDPKQDVKAAVDRSIVQVFTGFNLGPIQFANQRKEWSGDTMTFSLNAKLGFLQTPIQGSALVTDSEVILDVDLGLLGKLIPEQAARTQIADRTKGLLKN